jgi:hypothetical protein
MMNEVIKAELIKNGTSPEFIKKIEDMYNRLVHTGPGLTKEEYQTYRDYCERMINWMFKK